MPTSDQLASIEVPCAVVAGSENRDPAATHHWAYEAAQWAAEALDAPLVETPGAHGSMITHPAGLRGDTAPDPGRLRLVAVEA